MCSDFDYVFELGKRVQAATSARIKQRLLPGQPSLKLNSAYNIFASTFYQYPANLDCILNGNTLGLLFNQYPTFLESILEGNA